MRRSLLLHPDYRAAAVAGIEVDIERQSPGVLALNYALTGRVGDLALPGAAIAARTDDLWKHTCFELFIRDAGGPGYYEFNFSPSTQWAAYRFDSYRAGMRAAEVFAPRIETRAGEDRFEIWVTLEAPRDAGVWVAASAVIEEQSGAKSYWALAHPPGQADFHNADGFALNLEHA